MKHHSGALACYLMIVSWVMETLLLLNCRLFSVNDILQYPIAQIFFHSLFMHPP